MAVDIQESDAVRATHGSAAAVVSAGWADGGAGDLASARRWVTADALARFRAARGEQVTFDVCGAAGIDALCVEPGTVLDAASPAISDWAQRLFLELLRAGAVYRVGAGPELQWRLRLSSYHAENERRLDGLGGWPAAAVEGQRAAIGRVDGVELDARRLDGRELTVFTPHADTVAEAAFVALSPYHRQATGLVADPDRLERLKLAGGRGGEDGVIATDCSAVVPGVSRPLPVVVTGAVDSRFGPTAVLGSPSADPVDERIARRLIGGTLAWKATPTPAKARSASRFAGPDLAVASAAAHGPPVPAVDCTACGLQPLDVRELGGDGGAERCECPSCGGGAALTRGALAPGFVAIAAELMLVARAREPSGVLPALSSALPAAVALRPAGSDQLVLAERTIAKALRDAGLLELPDGEPYSRVVVHGAVNRRQDASATSAPALVAAHGADRVRLALLYAAAPATTFVWRDDVLAHCAAFADSLLAYARPRLEASRANRPPAAIDRSDALRRRLAFWARTGARKVGENLERVEPHRAIRNVMALFERIEDFERRAARAGGELAPADREAVAAALELLVGLLAPLAPGLASELCEQATEDA